MVNKTLYIIHLEDQQNGTFLVTFPDVPGLITFGAAPWECKEIARSAVAAWLEINPDGVEIAIGE